MLSMSTTHVFGVADVCAFHNVCEFHDAEQVHYVERKSIGNGRAVSMNRKNCP